MVFLVLLAVLATIAASIFIYIKRIESYWDRRGVYTYHPKKGENLIQGAYKAFKGRGLKYGGCVKYYKPTFLPIDLDVVKDVLIKNSDYFLNRGMYSNPKIDPMSASLPRLENQKWKGLRSIVSPVFSSGKMRMIFSDIADHAKIMQNVIAKRMETKEPMEVKDIAKRFGMDSMGSCTFGFEINTLGGHNEEFKDIVKDIMKLDWKKIAENLINRDILRLFRMRMSNPKIEAYIRNIVNDTMEYREKNSVQRNDIFQYIQQITDENVTTDEMYKNGKLSPDQMILTLNTFFVGGFETSTTLTCFTILEMCWHQDIQEKLRQHIREKMGDREKLTYDDIMQMDYLDCVINETLRLHPPSSSVSRLCNRPYRVPDTNIVINPGEFVSIPIYGIQTDPDYYPDPQKFDPERFTPENKAKRHPMAFIPFGGGPRQCIGMRLGLLVSKVAVAAIISKFKVTLNEKTITPIQYNKRSLFLDILGGLWIDCAKAED